MSRKSIQKRAWPPLIKMDEAVKNKINCFFGNAGDKLWKIT